jgi:hypothetical protein
MTVDMDTPLSTCTRHGPALCVHECMFSCSVNYLTLPAHHVLTMCACGGGGTYGTVHVLDAQLDRRLALSPYSWMSLTDGEFSSRRKDAGRRVLQLPGQWRITKQTWVSLQQTRVSLQQQGEGLRQRRLFGRWCRLGSRLWGNGIQGKEEREQTVIFRNSAFNSVWWRVKATIWLLLLWPC